MKKVLVATCVMAMAAFGITHASADPVDTARASAYGINLRLLGEGLIEREPEVTSVLPPGGLVVEDIITPDVEPITIAGTGVVLAETRRESTIVPYLVQQRGETSPIGGGGGGEEGLLGGIFEDLLGGGGGGGGGLTDNLLGGGGGGGTGILSEGDADTVEAQQLDGLTGGGGGGEGTLGGLFQGEDGLLGGLLNNEEGGDVADDEIVIPAVNAQALSRIEDLNIVTEDLPGLEGLDAAVLSLVVDALLEVEAVTAEAVAVCVDNQVFFDTASFLVSTDNEPVTVVDNLVDAVEDLGLEGLIEVERNEVGPTADGNGVFVNALRVTLLGDSGGGGEGEGLLGGLLDGGGGTTGGIAGLSSGEGEVRAQQVTTTIPDVTIPGVTTTIPDVTIPGVTTTIPGVPTTLPDAGGDGEGDAVLEIILGHAEVSGNVCAAAPPAPPAPPLTPTGPGDTLPVTGGGFGILPAVAALGLAGGAVAAGRLALRARRDQAL